MGVVERQRATSAALTRLEVTPFVTNIQRPTHMEWTLDGRLLVSEQLTGMIKDITHGGDARDIPPIAWGLRRPAGIAPLEDGRILVAEMHGGTVSDISEGGDMSGSEPFAFGLHIPYNIVLRRREAQVQILVSEDPSLTLRQYSDITAGGGSEGHHLFITNIPARPHYQRVMEVDHDLIRADDGGFSDQIIGDTKCGSWGIVLVQANDEMVMTVSSMGILVRTPASGGEFLSFAAKDENMLAWGLQPMAGMKDHPWNGLIYISQPTDGAIQAVDPCEPHNVSFDPPVLRLPRPGFPSCVRFASDGETMYVCDRGFGMVWKVTGFLH